MLNNRKIKKLKVFTDFVSNIAELSVSQTLKVGAMAVRADLSKIGSFGYNGSYPGAEINNETGGEENCLVSGSSGFVHAEMNLIAKFREQDPENYIVLLTHSPCDICMKLIVNSGFRFVFWKEYYRVTEHLKVLDKLGVRHGTFEDLNNFYETILEGRFETKK